IAFALLGLVAGGAGLWYALHPPTGDNPGGPGPDTARGPAGATGLGALRRDAIDPDELAEEAPPELVAVLADGRLKHWYFVKRVAFSAEGSILASGSWDGTVKLWDPATGRCRRTLAASDWVGSAAFQPGGRLLAAATRSGAVILWDWKAGAEVRRFPHHG